MTQPAVVLSHVSYADYNGKMYDAVLTFSRDKYTFDHYVIGYPSSSLSASEIFGLIKDKYKE